MIKNLQVPKCRAITVERIYTTGFTITADQYESVGPFTTVLHISYLAGANKTISIVQVRTIGSDVCVRDAILDATGKVDLADYNITDTHMIYAMIKSVIVGGNTIQCCTPLPSGEFDYTNCPNSNYIRFTVTDTGNIQFLSNPSGAHIWLAPTGQVRTDTTQTTPGTILDLPVGDYDYTLKLINYNDYISAQPITIIKNQTTIVGPIDLVPSEGCIYFSSSPQGARIYLALAGQTPVDTGLNTPNIICGKPLGDYTYKLTLPGYEDATGTVTLTSGHGEIVTKTLRELPIISDITISPLNPSISVNTDQQFSATPLDQYGNPIAATITWSSSSTYVGIIDPNTGMFSALHTGTSIITASSSSITKTTTVTVTPLVPVLTTITVSPSTLSIQTGNAAIFTAMTLDQSGNPFPTTVTWTSSNTNVGTIAQNGIFTAISAGTTTIIASSGNINGVAVANVTPAPVIIPVLTTITVSPNTTSVMIGNSTVFIATTLDQYGNPFPTTVTWDSSDIDIGEIDQSGLFSAIYPGTTIIRATSDTISGSAIVNVIPSPVLDKIIISPSTLSISTNNSAIFTATTLDQYGDPFPATVIWTSSNENIGTIQQNGVFAAMSPGATTITASSGNISGIAIANVTQLPIILPVLTKIEIMPLTMNLTVGSNTVFSASTLDQFGNPIATPVTWNSSDTNVGTITQNGVFTAISTGTTTIMASNGNINGIALANVTPVVPTERPTLANIVITPLAETILVGAGTVFSVSTLDQFGNPIATPVTWNSSDPNIGTIDQYGIFSALHVGKTTITASGGDIVGVALANVVTTLPGQPTGGVLGNINNAALILGVAMVGAVVIAKPSHPEYRAIERSRI